MTTLHYFTAPWCGPCRVFGPALREAAAEAGLQVVAHDIDTPEGAKEAARMMVHGIPVVIARDEAGNVVGRFGALPPHRLREKLEELR